MYGDMSAMVKTIVRATAAALMLGSAAMVATATGARADGAFHQTTNTGNTGWCLQPLATGSQSPVVQRPCDNTNSLQLWTVLSTPSGGTHYRFQNADGWCISTDSLRNGDPVHTDECAVSGGTTVSNAEWNASSSIVSGQAIVVALQSRLGFVNRAECLDEPGALPGNSNMQMWVCNGTNAQRWLVNSNN
jgi:hypothetical protein